VPEAERARLREKMEKRRRELAAKALQEKLQQASERQEAGALGLLYPNLSILTLEVSSC
jgi:hypothetical protein